MARLPSSMRSPRHSKARLAAALVVALVLVSGAMAASASTAASAGHVSIGGDSLGCTFTVVAPHIDHSGTSTDGILKGRVLEQCDRKFPEIIARLCLSYWNGARWVRIVCNVRDLLDAKSAGRQVFHRGGCDSATIAIEPQGLRLSLLRRLP